MKALIELAGEEFQLGKLQLRRIEPSSLDVAGDAVRAESTRTTMNTVEELTGKGPKVEARSWLPTSPSVEERGRDIQDILRGRTGQGRAFRFEFQRDHERRSAG